MAMGIAPPIIIVGMPRSGTTLTAHLLGSRPSVHVEVEPHVLWKAGSFSELRDDRWSTDSSVHDYIRRSLLQAAGSRLLVEKSPNNVIRPALVAAVFPEAKIVYVRRDPVRCIYSNMQRSRRGLSWKPAIIFRKYFRFSGSTGLQGAISQRTLRQQLRPVDVPTFTVYSARMMYLRHFRQVVPFGPKVEDFPKIVGGSGFLRYHAMVYAQAEKAREQYHELFPGRVEEFRMERLQSEASEIGRLLEFAGLDASERIATNLLGTLDQRKAESARERQPEDALIRKELSALGVLGT